MARFEAGNICGLRRSRETLNLRPKAYASSVMVDQNLYSCTGQHGCEIPDFNECMWIRSLPRCCVAVFFLSFFFEDASPQWQALVSPQSNIWCKSRPQREWSLASSSYFSMSMSLVLICLLKTPLNLPCVLFPLASSPYLPSKIRCTCLSHPSRACFRGAYKLGNRTRVVTTLLVTRSNQLMLRIRLRKRRWKGTVASLLSRVEVPSRWRRATRWRRMSYRLQFCCS